MIRPHLNRGHRVIISGREISNEIRQEVKAEIRALKRKTPFGPGLSVILVGDDPASEVYVRNKVTACSNVGIASFSHTLPKDIEEKKLLSLIESLNENEQVHGILVQWPLPQQIRWKQVIEAISPEKDVDGFHPFNVATLFTDTSSLAPCTPLGIMELLDRTNIEIQGKTVVIIGASNIVGKPLGLMMLNRHATVTFCHIYTKNLSEMTRQADILVTAVGKINLVTREMVKEGAVVVDVGINFVEGRTVGDVDFEGVVDKVSAITPVPGGVGPMTMAMLMKNTLLAFKTKNRLE